MTDPKRQISQPVTIDEEDLDVSGGGFVPNGGFPGGVPVGAAPDLPQEKKLPGKRTPSTVTL